MAKKGWFDKMLRKYRDEGIDEDKLDKMRDEAMHELPAEAFEGEGGDGDQHVHVHLHNGGSTDDDDEEVPPPAADPEHADPAVAEVAERVDALEQQVEMLMADEEDVELEDQDTQDKRRFKLRRRVKARDAEDNPMPEHAPEMIGTTDLPGIEDLDSRMAPGSTVGTKKAAIAYSSVGDSASMETLWSNTIAAAEIVVPGFRVPTFDAKHTPVLTAKRLCALRRGCLDAATKDAATKAVVERFTGGASLQRLPCDALKIAFNATADVIRTERNGGIIRQGTGDAGGVKTVNVPSNRDFNKAAREMWAAGSGNGSVRH